MSNGKRRPGTKQPAAKCLNGAHGIPILVCELVNLGMSARLSAGFGADKFLCGIHTGNGRRLLSHRKSEGDAVNAEKPDVRPYAPQVFPAHQFPGRFDFGGVLNFTGRYNRLNLGSIWGAEFHIAPIGRNSAAWKRVDRRTGPARRGTAAIGRRNAAIPKIYSAISIISSSAHKHS